MVCLSLPVVLTTIAKYLATFTLRADGSSKYQQKWGVFPSAGLAGTSLTRIS